MNNGKPVRSSALGRIGFLLAVSCNAAAGAGGQTGDLPRSTLEIGGAYSARQFETCAKDLPYTMVKLGAATHLGDGQSVPEWFPAAERDKLGKSVGRLVPGWARDTGATRHLSVHMWKRHHHPNYPDVAARTAIDGTPYLIPLNSLPERWKDAPDPYRYAMSYLHPAFFDAVRANIIAGLRQGVSVFEFQDSLRDYFHDFSPAALRGFREHSRSVTGNERWADTLERFIATGRARPARATMTVLQKEHPQVLIAWKEYYLTRAADFYRRLNGSVRAYANENGLAEPRLLLHEWILQPDSLSLLPHLDGIWAEATPQVSGFIAAAGTGDRARARPPAQDTYPPNGALAALVRVYAGAAGGKRVVMTPFGMQTGFQLPFKKGAATTLMQLQLAQIYASGGSYTHWCTGISQGTLGKSNVRRMLDGLPGSHFDVSRRAQKAQRPLDIAAMAAFVRVNANLYDDFEPLPDTLVLMTDAAYRGEREDPVFGWVQLLDDIRVPNTVLIDGSARRNTPVRLTAQRLYEFPSLLLLGPPSSYTREQMAAIDSYRLCTAHSLFVGDRGWQALWQKDDLQIVGELGRRYLELNRPAQARATARTIFSGAIRDNLGERVILRVDRHRADRGHLNVHLINLDYDWMSDSVTAKKDAMVRIDLDRLKLTGLVPGRVGIVTLEGNALGVQVDRGDGFLEARISRLGAYSVLSVEHAQPDDSG